MSFMDDLKRWAKGEDEEDEEDDRKMTISGREKEGSSCGMGMDG